MKKAKNLLFVEIIVVILFFSIAAAGCVTLFGEAKYNSNKSRELTEAVIIAQNYAELFKAAGGNLNTVLVLSNDRLEAFIEIIADGKARITIKNAERNVYELTVKI